MNPIARLKTLLKTVTSPRTVCNSYKPSPMNCHVKIEYHPKRPVNVYRPLFHSNVSTTDAFNKVYYHHPSFRFSVANTNSVIKISATASTQPPVLMATCTTSTLNNPFRNSQ